ncbi:SDR family oxidoreductase [Nocardia bovistercoris]|uniref:SDR family oxidoreductase n=1 Tax=Nocardia bovistercoris TaxID=2785916 RepID=A0A931N723_9NOCA|nr:SDR family oxidoreductase [Nocardia bovistercoris]MBH0780308.1 SDR family oxidoreductase [Nocardia bovistercoris]
MSDNIAQDERDTPDAGTRPVSIITGGAGGMGVATAEILGRDHTVVLADVRAERLDAAVAALSDLGITATPVVCDVTEEKAVEELFDVASGLGVIASVIHTAGVSPSMGDADYVMRTNVLGTLHVGEVFYRRAHPDAALVNVASMAAHLLPVEAVPSQHFPTALRDQDAFLAEMAAICGAVPEEARSGYAYAIGKSFVKWYSESQAERFNGRHLRIVSVSPGSIETEMGKLEAEAGAGAMVADFAVPRWGKPEEMAALFAFAASPAAGYLTGTDILADGGVVASMRERARVAAQG